MPNRALIIYEIFPDPGDEAPARAVVESLGYALTRVSLRKGVDAVKRAVRGVRRGAREGDRILVVYHGEGTPGGASEAERGLVGDSELLGGPATEETARISAQQLYSWLVDGAAAGVTIVVVTDSCSDGSFFELRNTATITSEPMAEQTGGAFSYAPVEWAFAMSCRSRPMHQTPGPEIIVVAPAAPGCICSRFAEYVGWQREYDPGGGEVSRSVGEVCKFVSASRYRGDPFPLSISCTGLCPLKSVLTQI